MYASELKVVDLATLPFSQLPALIVFFYLIIKLSVYQKGSNFDF